MGVLSHFEARAHGATLGLVGEARRQKVACGTGACARGLVARRVRALAIAWLDQ
jgi:hypothetical protein